MEKFIINRDGSIEQDQVFLCDRMLNTICEIYPIDNLKTDMHFASNDEASFTLYKNNNNVFNPFWNKIDDLSIILVQGKGYFEIAVPKTDDGAIFKEITGVSLGEAETAQTNVTLEINTDDDMDRDDYVETVLYNETNTEGSLLHRIFKVMPHYTIGHVDDSIKNIQRTFSVSDTTVYDFLQQIAEEIGCVFVFDNFSRTVNCYDLQEHCTNPKCIADKDHRNIINGVCQHCNSSDYVVDGYGEDTGVFIEGASQEDNTTETITITGDKDSVKNCFKVEGGDDIVTDRIASRLIGGNYIWKFSDYQKSQMSENLQIALSEWEKYVATQQDTYNKYWDKLSANIDQISYYRDSMMPNDDTDETTAESVCQEIFGGNGKTGKITYTCLQYRTIDKTMLSKTVSNFAKAIAPSTYTVELNDIHTTTETDGTFTVINSLSFKAHIYLKDEYEDDGITLKDEYTSSTITLPVKKGYKLYVNENDNKTYTSDYFYYLKQQIDIKLEQVDTKEEVMVFDPPLDPTTNKYQSGYNADSFAEYDNETNTKNLQSNHYTMFCIERLQSYFDAYEACSQVISKKNAEIASDDATEKDRLLMYIKDDNTKEPIFDSLLGKYKRRMECLSARISYLNKKIESLEKENDTLSNKINVIRNNCDLQNFLTRVENALGGKDLWIELCTFRRTDTYKNDNFIGEDQPESVLMENVEELLKQANIEIEKACKVNYSTTATIANLLTLKEFESFWDKFKLGNYIRVRVDEDIYTMRIITVSFDYSDLSHCSVEFSDTIKNKVSSVNHVKDILKQASSMASSYSYVARQADKGSKANQQFQNMKENGLDIANTMIKSSDNLDFVWNKYGFKGREWDDVKNEFAPEQLAMTNNLLAFTKDSWEHTCAAIGKISYFDDVDQTYKWDYGINAGVLIGDLVMSEQLRIMNDSGNYYIDKNGFTMVKKDSNGKVLSEIAIKPENPSMVLSRNGKSLFDFNSDGLGCLRIGSDTSGITFDQSGNAAFAGKISSSSGNIGSWHIDGSGIYNTGNNYLTTIGNRDDYKIEGKYYQTTINNGKIICGVESGDYTSPDTSYGYVDVSARGIYAKTFGRAVTDDYLFALDVQQNLITTNCSNVDIKNNLQCDGNFTCTQENTKASIRTADITTATITSLNFTNQYIKYHNGTEYVYGDFINDGGWQNTIALGNVNCDLRLYAKAIYQGSGSTTITSDERVKTNFDTLEKYEDAFFDFKPISFEYLVGTSNRKHMGFGAGQVLQTLKNHHIDTKDFGAFVESKTPIDFYEKQLGYIPKGIEKTEYSLRYEEFIALNTHMIQKLYKRVEELETLLERSIT